MSDVEYSERLYGEIVEIIGDDEVARDESGRAGTLSDISDIPTSHRELSAGSQSASSASNKAVHGSSEQEALSTPTRSRASSGGDSCSISSFPSFSTPMTPRSLSRTSSVRTLQGSIQPSDPLNRKLKQFYRFVSSGRPLNRERSTYDMAVEIATLRAYEELFNKLHSIEPIKLPQDDDDSSQSTQ